MYYFHSLNFTVFFEIDKKNLGIFAQKNGSREAQNLRYCVTVFFTQPKGCGYHLRKTAQPKSCGYRPLWRKLRCYKGNHILNVESCDFEINLSLLTYIHRLLLMQILRIST